MKGLRRKITCENETRQNFKRKGMRLKFKTLI